MTSGLTYWRLHGTTGAYRVYSDDELRRLAAMVPADGDTYARFNNVPRPADSLRFVEITGRGCGAGGSSDVHQRSIARPRNDLMLERVHRSERINLSTQGDVTMPNEPKHEPNEPNLDVPGDRKGAGRQPTRQPGGGQRDGTPARSPGQPGGAGKPGADKRRDDG